jgi:Protein of unknown function (DUF2950)
MTLERSGPKRSYSSGFIGAAVVAFLSVGLFSNVAAAQSAGKQTASAGKMSMGQKSTGPQAGQQTFPSPADASQALVAAIQKDDEGALLKVLGLNAKDIISSGDPAEDKQNRAQFAQKYQQMHRLRTEPDGTTTLYIGAENWPTPIPLMHKGSAWYFDTAAGKQEILYRRIGKNEMAVIQTCTELVDAEKEYYAQPHDGGADRQYAQKFFSDTGKQNGLYWETASGETNSPIGPLVAVAENEGQAPAPNRNLEPFQGYYFRILKTQGPKAPGGSHSYIADGKMTRGFAFVAYPAEYRSSGVMTFLVGQDGVVYEKDLGPHTSQIAKTLAQYNPDASWRKAD